MDQQRRFQHALGGALTPARMQFIETVVPLLGRAELLGVWLRTEQHNVVGAEFTIENELICVYWKTAT